MAATDSTAAQDPGEMFDVMEPPPSQWDPPTSRPVGTGAIKARAAVHRDRDWHRSVHVWLLDPVGRALLLQKRSMKKDTFPGRWDISVAGHIGAGDDARGAAVREAEEELGIQVSEAALASGFVGCLPAEMAARGGCNCYEEVFVLVWDARDGFAPGAAEVDAVKWLGVDALEAALPRADESVVPRADGYAELFFPACRRLCDEHAAARRDGGCSCIPMPAWFGSG